GSRGGRAKGQGGAGRGPRPAGVTSRRSWPAAGSSTSSGRRARVSRASRRGRSGTSRQGWTRVNASSRSSDKAWTPSATRCSSASAKCADASWPSCGSRSARRSRRRDSPKGSRHSCTLAAAAEKTAIAIVAIRPVWPQSGFSRMPDRANPVDPPDLGLMPTFRRLLRLWWAERRLGALGLALAFCYTVISITIPLISQRAIDDAIVNHRRALWPYILGIVGLAALRFGVNFSRRFATARIGIRIEAKMRELLYSAYLRYPRAFYDRHATGQVLSRATNDLYPIRYFIG